MRILVVEDDENKRRRVEDFLRETVPKDEVQSSHSFTSALKRLRSTTFDLVILDMTLPTFDVTASDSGGRTQALGGKELLRQMARMGLNCPAVVLTQYESFGEGAEAKSLGELNAELEMAYSARYFGAIFYGSGQSAWLEELAGSIERARLAASRRH